MLARWLGRVKASAAEQATTMAAQLATKPDRARLLAQLRNVEAQLAKLDLEEQQQHEQPKPVAAAATKVQDVKLNKRARRALARQGETGPLPPSLASAPKRHIALLFSYEGWAHSGLAYQPKGVYTPLPTVEGCLLAALEKARLIEPIEEGEGFGCGFERCGRTDAGVSSSAQVVNLWVRSDLDDPMQVNGREIDPESVEGRRHARSRSRSRSRSPSSSEADSEPGQPTRAKKRNDVEIPYVTLLNKHLPPSIRIHAWSPVSATFSSRYSCIWRHYKYFFSTSPSSALLATRFDFGAAYQALDHGRYPEHATSDWRERLAGIDWHGLELDVDLMRDAVQRLVGEHDFRNFCKVDPPKQLPIHVRTVLSATIDPLEGEGDDMFVLNLRGGAFVSVPVLAYGTNVGELGATVLMAAHANTCSSTTKSGTSWRSSSSSARALSRLRLSTGSCGLQIARRTPSRRRPFRLPRRLLPSPPPLKVTRLRSKCSTASRVIRWRPTCPSFFGNAGSTRTSSPGESTMSRSSATSTPTSCRTSITTVENGNRSTGTRRSGSSTSR